MVTVWGILYISTLAQFVRKVGNTMNKKLNTKGFTIIEVVLVLAIAGLIMVMVFSALPALQRGQRDTARKNDASSVASSITTYTSNNRGSFPPPNTYNDENSTGTFDPPSGFGGYLSNLSQQTVTVAVKSALTSTTTVSPVDGEVWIISKSKCGTSGTTNQTLDLGSTPRQFTVVTKLESGGGAYFCQDS